MMAGEGGGRPGALVALAERQAESVKAAVLRQIEQMPDDTIGALGFFFRRGEGGVVWVENFFHGEANRGLALESLIAEIAVMAAGEAVER